MIAMQPHDPLHEITPDSFWLKVKQSRRFSKPNQELLILPPIPKEPNQNPYPASNQAIHPEAGIWECEQANTHANPYKRKHE
jgi:hypothetical protein